MLLVLAAAPVARAASCEAEANRAEQSLALPPDLLLAIGRVESGRRAEGGRVSPWPWSVNALGEGHFLASAQEAIALVRSLQARGIRSIDVGCFQINLFHHPEAFQTLAEAFDPASNARAAAQILDNLHSASGSWERSVAAYHSAVPALGAPYLQQVMASWHGGVTMAEPPVSQVAASIRVFVPSSMTATTAKPERHLDTFAPDARPIGRHLPIVIVPMSSRL